MEQIQTKTFNKRVVMIDAGYFMFASIFSYAKRKDYPPTFTALRMMIGNLKRVGIRPDDLVIIAVDSKKGSWRKDVDPCLDEITEVLTEEGWMFLKDIVEQKLKIKVATLNPDTDKVEYHYPINYFKYYHEGRMYKLGGKCARVDMLMTPSHKHLCRVKGTTSGFYLKEAKDITTRSPIESNREFNYDSKEIEHFILPKFRTESSKIGKQGAKYTYIVEYPEKKFSMDSWLKLLGWYLSEGCIGKRKIRKVIDKITFSQSESHNPTYCEEIRRVLKDNKLNVYEQKRKNNIISFSISDTQLATYLAQFGKARDKFIPRELLSSLNKRQSKILLSCLLKGDGTIREHKHLEDNWAYTTISKRLADDVQELALKAGFTAIITRSHSIYFVNITRDFTPSTYKKTINDWKGNTYDLEVPNHLFFIRREGKVCWTGNCYKANRKESREKHDIDWKKHFEEFNDLYERLDGGTPFHVVNIEKLEADDTIAFSCRYFKDRECIIISVDADYEQLVAFPNVKLFSPISKRYKKVKNPYAVLASKIRKEQADNLITEIHTELDYEKREKIVNLLRLPEEIDKKVEEAIHFLPEKDFDYELIPFNSIRESFKTIYGNEKYIVPENSLSRAEKRKLREEKRIQKLKEKYEKKLKKIEQKNKLF